jgi:hypothetical protein
MCYSPILLVSTLSPTPILEVFPCIVFPVVQSLVLVTGNTYISPVQLVVGPPSRNIDLGRPPAYSSPAPACVNHSFEQLGCLIRFLVLGLLQARLRGPETIVSVLPARYEAASADAYGLATDKLVYSLKITGGCFSQKI